MHSRGADDRSFVSVGDGGTGCSTEYNRRMSSSRSRSFKLLVYIDGGRRDMSMGGCTGEGGRFGQWDAKLGRSSGFLSGSIIAGRLVDSAVAEEDADLSTRYFGWT